MTNQTAVHAGLMEQPKLSMIVFALLLVEHSLNFFLFLTPLDVAMPVNAHLSDVMEVKCPLLGHSLLNTVLLQEVTTIKENTVMTTQWENATTINPSPLSPSVMILYKFNLNAEAHALQTQASPTMKTSTPLCPVMVLEQLATSRQKFNLMVQSQVLSLSTKTSLLTRVESTLTNQVLLLVATPSKSLDGDLKTVKTTGSVSTHGTTHGATTVLSRSCKATVESTHKCMLVQLDLKLFCHSFNEKILIYFINIHIESYP